MHEHNDCDHDLKYCSKCDVVYCTKCLREWGGHSHTWIYPGWTYRPYTIWSGTSGWQLDPNVVQGTATVGSSFTATNPPHEHS